MDKALDTYRESSDSANVYRDSSALNVATLDTSAVLGNYADMMKNNIVIPSEIYVVDEAGEIVTVE